MEELSSCKWPYDQQTLKYYLATYKKSDVANMILIFNESLYQNGRHKL